MQRRPSNDPAAAADPGIGRAAQRERPGSVSASASAVTGIAWPAVPATGRAATIRAVLSQLDQTQWWSAEKIRRAQDRQLGLLLAHAHRTVPFYRKRLVRAGLAPGGTVSVADWPRIPLLTRADIQEAGEALLTRDLPAGHGRVHDIFTSGSTGRPIRALRTELWAWFWRALTIRDHLWHRRDFGGKLAVIRHSGKNEDPYPDGTASPNWSSAYRGLFATGPAVGLNVHCTVEQQVDWLRRQDPDYLLTHPTIARRLAEHCLAHGIRLPRLRQLLTYGEVATPMVRAASRAAWGAPAIDMYSTREVGYLAFQCPEHEHYHVQAEATLVEVLDERGRPCAPGQVGRVVATPLHNFAMPLIRYDIGDQAEVGGPCPCGRGLPVLRRILGRTQNMFVLPSGERLWPMLSSDNVGTLLAIAPIRQYQFVQKSPELIVLRLAVARDLSPLEEDALRRWVREKFGHPFRVAFEYHAEIPLTAAGKFQDFVCEVA